MKPYRVVERVCSYSKKKGAYYHNITLEKGIASLQDAQNFVKRYKPTAKKTSETTYITSGLLYPGKIEIKNF